MLKRLLRFSLALMLLLLSACSSAKDGATPPTSTPSSGPSAPAQEVNSAEVTLPDGLKYTDIVVGTGATPRRGQTVSVRYTGKLQNGIVFDSTAKQGGIPYQFQLGMGRVIAGWDEGIASMKVGGKRKLVIPPKLGYGERASGFIPPHSVLLFEVELVGVK